MLSIALRAPRNAKGSKKQAAINIKRALLAPKMRVLRARNDGFLESVKSVFYLSVVCLQSNGAQQVFRCNQFSPTHLWNVDIGYFNRFLVLVNNEDYRSNINTSMAMYNITAKQRQHHFSCLPKPPKNGKKLRYIWQLTRLGDYSHHLWTVLG